MKPVQNELPLMENIRTPNSDQTELFIFNTSNLLMYGFDNSSFINVRLDGKGICQLNVYEFVRLIIPKGNHRLDLVHKDIWLFASQHQMEFVKDKSYLSVYATIKSNGVKLLPNLPKDFKEKFRPVGS